MNVVEINTCDYGSTGKIMLQIASLSKENGNIMTFSRKWKNNESQYEENYYIGSFIENGLHHVLSAITGFEGCFSTVGTKAFLKKLDKIKPDIIHLHNLHGWYINLPLLFKYIKKNNIKTIWTLHDCWALTGHCPHFDMIGCEKWKTGCYSCPQHRDYPQTLIDRSKAMHEKKKKWFTGVQDLTIITPSNWLARLVKESFLKDYPVKVIHNGVDLSVFQPTESDFKERYGIGADKFILLGVAFGWGKRKGLDVFVELAKRLPERFQIVLVGTDRKVDEQLPKNIVSIHRTQNQTELAEIYTAADLFVNPTREDNFPTVNIESLACGTPIVTFRTGGSPEIIDESCGAVVEKDDIDSLEGEIVRIAEEQLYSVEACVLRAKQFDQKDKFAEYVKLYQGEV